MSADSKNLTPNARRLFLAQLSEQRDELMALLGSNQIDRLKVRLIAHTIKGSAGFFGATQLAAVANALEQATVGSGDLVNVGRDLVAQIDDFLK
jgi:HPt (histidine-containing phosphotransfer) domain-containing protein